MSAQEFHENMCQLHFATDGVPTIRISAGAADLTVWLEGSENEVIVDVTAPEGIDLSPVRHSLDGDVIHVEVPPLQRTKVDSEDLLARLQRIATFGISRSADIVVRGPEGANLQLNTRGGDVQVHGRPESATVVTGGGDVSFDVVDPFGAAIPRIDATTGGGDMRVPGVGRARLHSGGGDIALLAGHDVDLHTGAGYISVGEVTGEVKLVSGSGDVGIDIVSAGTTNARTGSGDIAIGVRDGVPVWQDITSGHGEVDCDIDPVGAPEEGQPYITLRLTTGSGDIRVRTVH